jgi:threonine dehydrogenase-like Zn-dependent dehydrogenase
MQKGDILGHEFMGEIVELGSSVKNKRIGDLSPVYRRGFIAT